MHIQFNFSDNDKGYLVTSEDELLTFLQKGLIKPNTRVYDGESGRLIKLYQIESIKHLIDPFLDESQRNSINSTNTIDEVAVSGGYSIGSNTISNNLDINTNFNSENKVNYDIGSFALGNTGSLGDFKGSGTINSFDPSGGSTTTINEISSDTYSNNKNEVPTKTETKESNKILLVLISIFVVISLGIFSFTGRMFLINGDGSLAYNVLFLIGKMAGVFIIFILPIILLSKKKNNPKRIKGIKIALILSIALVGMSFIDFSFSTKEITVKNQEKATVNKITELYGSFIKSESPTKEVYEENVYGKNAVMLNALAEYIFESKKDETKLEELTKDVGSINPIAIIDNNDEYSKAQGKIKDCITQYQQMYTKSLSYQKKVKEIMDSVTIDPQDKKTLDIKSNQSKNEEFKTTYKQFIDVEILVLNTLNRMYEYIKVNNNGKKFQISNGQLLFYNNEDIMEFNKFSKEIEELSKKEDEYLKALKKIQQENYAKLQDESANKQ